jgi:hypothetical protein
MILVNNLTKKIKERNNTPKKNKKKRCLKAKKAKTYFSIFFFKLKGNTLS